MILDRLEFLNAIGFLKHVIPEEDESGKNCLFVRVDNDKLILTAGSEFTAKKVTLLRPISIESSGEKEMRTTKPENFMIPKGTLVSFETLLNKHKKKAKKLAKNDQSFLYIDVDEEELESFGVLLRYKQPSFQFKDLESLFSVSRNTVAELCSITSEIDSIIKGFAKSKQLKMTFTGEDSPVYFHQESTGYEAILIPKPEETEDEG